MRIIIPENKEQVELVQAMASRDKTKSIPAQEAFAAFIAKIANKVLPQLGSASLIYTDVPYDEFDAPSIPIDPYFGTRVNHVTVWSQSMAGGLPTSLQTGSSELKVATYTLDSAVSWLKTHAQKARLSVISMYINRMIQEVLIKQERNAWAVALRALAEASTNGNTHYIDATTADVLQLDDFNKMLTRNKRTNVSFDNGTPENPFSEGITDLFMSPEMTEQIRGFAYQPMNTRAGHTGSTQSNTAIPLPDATRENILKAGGEKEIYGITLHELNEFGVGQKYNILFGTFGPGSFTVASDEILVGVDIPGQGLLRPVAKNSDNGSTLTVIPDDQFYSSRSNKQGVYLTLEEARVCIDARVLGGVTV